MISRKSIAVVTHHRSYNYGAVLQAYATLEVLRQYGFDPFIIDYVPKKFQNYGSFRVLLDDVSCANSGAFVRVMKAFVKSRGRGRRNRVFDRFIHDELAATRPYLENEDLISNPPPADIYCTGSDQVWNNYYTGGFDQAYFLNFAPSGAPRVALASSFGRDEFLPEEQAEIQRSLEMYSYVSVRETSGRELLLRLGHEDADIMLDPTLLLPTEYWTGFAHLAEIAEPYVLAYQLHGESNTWELAREFARRNKMKLIRIVTLPYQMRSGCDNVVAPSVRSFVGLFASASYVFTDSYHGSIFSALFSKRMAVSLPPRFGGRVTTLLGAIGAEALLCRDLNAWESAEASTDYQEIYRTLLTLVDEKRNLLAWRLSGLV